MAHTERSINKSLPRDLVGVFIPLLAYRVSHFSLNADLTGGIKALIITFDTYQPKRTRAPPHSQLPRRDLFPANAQQPITPQAQAPDPLYKNTPPTPPPTPQPQKKSPLKTPTPPLGGPPSKSIPPRKLTPN
ncbi:proline-rich receptor-like protein kinase PERK2 [Haliotis rufescens]|uniref:proline-rich receptor-like protein kinase PERK2 n=1 Tax=Haliotis rufescens TaxID=6454 RepID=UPI00201F3AF9|nr:proline-rich receptor-like protein kinase PERK2 [Haliotis rufescens]